MDGLSGPGDTTNAYGILGHNACKGAPSAHQRHELLTCPLCVSSDTRADDLHVHIFRSCQTPPLCQARLQSFGTLRDLPAVTDLEQLLIPVILPPVLEESGHRLCFGNCNSLQVSAPDTVLPPTNNVELIQGALLDFSKHLVYV